MKFEVVATTGTVRKDGVDVEKGTILEDLTAQQALEIRASLKPVDDEAELLFEASGGPAKFNPEHLQGMRPHAQLEFLQQQKDGHLQQAEKLGRMISQVEKKIDEDQKKRAATPAAKPVPGPASERVSS